MSLTGVFGEIIGAIVGLYVVNSIPSWHLSFITDAYLLYLPYANTAIIGACVVRMLMHLSPWYRLQMLFEGLFQIIGIFSLYMLLTVFPFDFGSINKIEINSLLRFGFNIAIVALFLALLVTCFQMLRGKAS
ncbi:MAG: hypothetical protein UW22_C0077G0002 [Candidatus Gottesmanbacteria bacterium GW2011_GWB1_44_11c]|uniref:Uncharacterized protein n=1 Tax=Candidatus Gottesmanbacteria bacterium GW2011_GWB1_44_11c TaxID=1618447 RepID=A0A0G1GHG1_9BACT|nr:MAG: hypothetical protein UW22_C0077G0002 [Candidatus Gottesmanbacteria bacterium GW2011_GWB1_44_11c]HCM81923.1 hypothetical protein [Patescibacteria group bacterium]